MTKLEIRKLKISIKTLNDAYNVLSKQGNVSGAFLDAIADEVQDLCNQLYPESQDDFLEQIQEAVK